VQPLYELQVYFVKLGGLTLFYFIGFLFFELFELIGFLDFIFGFYFWILFLDFIFGFYFWILFLDFIFFEFLFFDFIFFEFLFFLSFYFLISNNVKIPITQSKDINSSQNCYLYIYMWISSIFAISIAINVPFSRWCYSSPFERSSFSNQFYCFNYYLHQFEHSIKIFRSHFFIQK